MNKIIGLTEKEITNLRAKALNKKPVINRNAFKRWSGMLTLLTAIVTSVMTYVPSIGLLPETANITLMVFSITLILLQSVKQNIKDDNDTTTSDN